MLNVFFFFFFFFTFFCCPTLSNVIENVGQHALGNLGQSSNGGKYAFRDFISLMTRANIRHNAKWVLMLEVITLA